MNRINKEQKYRWHDLRKDPNDLPVRKKAVLIYTNCCDMYVAHLRSDYWVVRDSLGEYELSHYLNSSEIIAWKYIEEFKGE